MESYLKLAESLAFQAGEIILKYFKKGMKRKIKSDLSIVTNADEEINDLVVNTIDKKYPKHSILGEEGGIDKGSDLVWLCDPIDGTWPYAKKVPISVFSLALSKKGELVLGVVYDPFTDRLYSAVKGKGAFLNKKKILVSELEIKEATLNIEWWPGCEYDIELAMHKLSIDTGAYVLHLGSIVNACCFVAAGQYEACIYAGTRDKSVDVAAVKIIVEEAGGRVTDLFGKRKIDVHDLRGAIISNGIVHEDVLKYTRNLKKFSSNLKRGF
jgi:fructose-1,6-bisphosphatase/inositol monophosphatase family enzyme